MLASHNSDIGVSFYNDRVKEIVDAGIVAEPFTYVPITAGHMELVGGNALVFGKIKEGYDVIDIVVETEITYEDVSLDEPLVTLLVSYDLGSIEWVYYNMGDDGLPSPIPVDKSIWDGTQSWRTLYGVAVVTLPLTIIEGAIYSISVLNVVEGINYTVSYTALAGDTYVDVKAGLIAALVAAGVGAEIVYGIWSANKIFFYARNQSFMQVPVFQAGDVDDIYENFVITAYILALGLTIKFPQLKCGAVHSFGIVYKDRSGRVCSVIKSDDFDVYIPFYTEETELGDNVPSSIINLVFKIYHAPPVDKDGVCWAETYEIVYYGNISMDYFLQVRAFNIVTLDNDRFAISINDTITNIQTANKRWKVPDYDWEDGDRIRLIGTINATTGVLTLFDELYDYEIEEIGYTDPLGTSYADWLLCQAVDHPAIFGNETIIENLTGTLDGTVVSIPLVVAPPAARYDTITLAGAGGTATIICAGLSFVATFNGTLAQTAIDFKNDNETAYANIGITLTNLGDDIIFTATEEEVDFVGTTNILTEIYRPRKGIGQTLAYGTGMVFEIGTDADGNKYHKGNVDQSISLDSPAEVENTANDCWKFLRLNYQQIGVTQTGVIQPFWAESIFPSDWWRDQIISNKLTSQGFPFLDDLSQRQTVLDERIRHGGFLITGTRTNNIAHFTFDDFMDLPKKNGDITGLKEVGFTLKVVQLYKETSIYINRIQTFNPDGTEQFTLTDDFLAEQRPMETDYGCQHPNSIMVNGRNLYYWDNSQAAFIRSAPNGQIALSGPEYKMVRWFKDLSRWIRTSGGGQLLVVNIGANNDFDEIWITFRMGTVVKGIIFSEKRGRFTAEIDQITESYVHLGNFFAHLYHQRLWIMNVNEGQDYLSWVGEPVYAELEIVSNMEPSKNKVFQAIAAVADHLLQSLARFVHIPAEASAVGELMETNIPVFNRREGVYYGKIMKDENSKGVFASSNNRKLNGREMRGRFCFVKLRTTEHDEKVRVDSIVVLSTLSERNV